MSQNLTHDAHPNALITAVLDATTHFTLATSSFVLGSLGEIKDAARDLHLAARALYLATQVSPEALVDLAQPLEPSDDAISASDLERLVTHQAEPFRARIIARDIAGDRRAIYGAFADALERFSAVVTPSPNGATVDLTAALDHAVEYLNPSDED